MDYLKWKLFIDAAELGSLSKVAIASGKSQPQISRQIAELERECGARLFQRNGRGVALTEVGQRIAPRVRAWLASTEQLASDLQATAGKPVGTVRLGILPSTAHPLVTTLYYRLRQQFPLIQLSVREGQGAQLETWLEDGNVDLAILYRQSPVAKNGDVYLAEAATYLVGTQGDPLVAKPTVRFSTLDKLPLVTFCRPNSWRDRLDQLSVEHGIALNVEAEADSLSLQLRIVANGSAYALLGPYAIHSAPQDCPIKASRLVGPEIPRYVALAMSRLGELTLACKTVMRLIQEIAQSDATLSNSRK